MRFLTWAEKMVIQKMMEDALNRVFSQDMAKEIYLAYSEAVFSAVEQSEWFQNDEDILMEHIEQILGWLMVDSAKFMFEGEFEK